MNTQTTHFTYQSADHLTQIHAIEWKCGKEPAAIVQIVHGMQEFIDRYEDFARYLNAHDILVVGNDHLGHGASVADPSRFGYFAEKDGNRALIADMRSLHRMTEEKYPGVPYFMFGHSMGSFLVRQYICMYGKHLAGAIICGTAYFPPYKLVGGKLLARILAARKGWMHRSMFMTWLTMGSFNKKFEPARTRVDWFTRDEAIIDAYRKDSRTHHMFTLNAYYNMFTGLQYIGSPAHLARIPKDLPVLLAAGEMDPVGNFGAGVKKVAMQLKAVGLTDVHCVLYPNDRHEILNELDRQDVYKDLYTWLAAHMGRDRRKGERDR